MGKELYSEKVSVNMNSATLASIDLLVDNGYYSNRSDFINQAVRESLREQRSTIERIVEQNSAPARGAAARSGDHWFLGVSGITPRELTQLSAAGETLRLRGYGVLIIDRDCDEQLLFSVVEEIRVRGKVHCSPGVKAHYGIK